MARIGVSSDEILQNHFTISEIGRRVVLSFSMNSLQSFSEIFEPPNTSLKTIMLQQILILVDQFSSSQLNILIEQVDFGKLGLIVLVNPCKHGQIDYWEQIPHSP